MILLENPDLKSLPLHNVLASFSATRDFTETFMLKAQ
jgi:hypothetical protein